MLQNKKEDILIAEYDERIFYPYKGNRLQNIGFKTFKECKNHIKEKKLIGFEPELGWELGLGDYRTNFNSLMRVVEKICKEKFKDSDGSSNETSYLRTFGMIDENGDFMVRFNRSKLFIDETLIGATFQAVIGFLRNNH